MSGEKGLDKDTSAGEASCKKRRWDRLGSKSYRENYASERMRRLFTIEKGKI